MARKHGGLGKGLDALIGSAAKPDGTEVITSPRDPARVPIAEIRPGPWQPRRDFPSASMTELAESIREHGILQPLLVRRSPEGYELIAGERRLRAAREAGLDSVPVRVIEADDQVASEVALIENLQREDLDPIEEAEGYAALAARFHLSQEQIAARVGKARTSVSNALRLLGLPAELREVVRSGTLSTGHAKVLLGLPSEAEQLATGRRCVREGWSVRELEARLARARRAGRPRRAGPRATSGDPHLADLEARLRERLGTGVHLVSCRTLPGGKTEAGRMTIEYYSDDDLDRLLVLLGVSDEGL